MQTNEEIVEYIETLYWEYRVYSLTKLEELGFMMPSLINDYQYMCLYLCIILLHPLVEKNEIKRV